MMIHDESSIYHINVRFAPYSAKDDDVNDDIQTLQQSLNNIDESST